MHETDELTSLPGHAWCLALVARITADIAATGERDWTDAEVLEYLIADGIAEDEFAALLAGGEL